MNWLSRLVGGSAAAKLSPELKGILENGRMRPSRIWGALISRPASCSTPRPAGSASTPTACLQSRPSASEAACSRPPMPFAARSSPIPRRPRHSARIHRQGTRRGLQHRLQQGADRTRLRRTPGVLPEWQWLDLQWIPPVLFSEKISGQVRLNNWIRRLASRPSAPSRAWRWPDDRPDADRRPRPRQRARCGDRPQPHRDGTLPTRGAALTGRFTPCHRAAPATCSHFPSRAGNRSGPSAGS